MGKKLLLFCILFLPLILSSCGGDDEPDYTTYTVNYTIDDVQNVLVDLTFFEYNDTGEKIATNSISEAKKGTKKTFTASSRATKVKVYIKMYSSNSAITPAYRWVQNVFYLENGKNIDINLTNNTIIGNYEP